MANVQGRRFNGNLVYLDEAAHLKRIIDAIGPDVIKYVDDFTGGPAIDTAFDDDWTVTRVEAGAGESTVAKGDAAGGIITITTDAADNDGINMQLLGESFKLASGHLGVYFGIRLKCSATTQNDFFVGLAITDTDILGGVTDRIGFEKLDGVTAVKAMLEKDSTETLSGTLATLDTNWHTYEFYVDENNAVEFFVDGVSAYAPANTNLPNDEELRVSIHALTGEAVAKTFDVDWVRCIQIGGRAA